MRASPELQAFLDETIANLRAKDPNFGNPKFRVALVDLSRGLLPQLAHYNGETPVYPASVIKFVRVDPPYPLAVATRSRIHLQPVQ